MSARLALAAAFALTVAPLAGSASAKCVQPMSIVCSAIATACNEADKVHETELCNIQP